MAQAGHQVCGGYDTRQLPPWVVSQNSSLAKYFGYVR